MNNVHQQETDSEGSDSEEKIEKVAEKIDIEIKQEPPPMLLKSPEEMMQEVVSISCIVLFLNLVLLSPKSDPSAAIPICRYRIL